MPLNADVTVDPTDSLNGSKGMPFKPIGVDIPRNGKDNKSKPNGSMIAVIILSSVTAFVVLIGALWLFLLKCGCCSSDSQTEKTLPTHTSSHGKPSGNVVSFASARCFTSNSNAKQPPNFRNHLKLD